MKFYLLLSLTGSILLSASLAGQEVFREFTAQYGAGTAKHFNELDPGSKRTWDGPDQGWQKNFKHRAPKPIEVDLAQATRAEFSVEYWGGHIGTSEQRFKVNDQAWTDLPQPVGTPAAPERFHRTLLGNNAVVVPLAALKNGQNEVRFSAGPQIAYGFDWGFYWVYDFTVRVFYDAARPHPTGEIVWPKSGSTFGDSLQIEARVGSAGAPVARVEFIGEYDDFDWDGNGVWREWQFAMQHGIPVRHLGTATAAPWRVTWDARWLPDQAQPVRIRARVTDTAGMSYLTPPLEGLVQQRPSRSVRMYKPVSVPERYASRNGKASPKCTIMVEGDLAKATAARLVVSTWSANVDDDSVHEIRLNGERLANRFGVMHNYSLDTLEVPVARLKPGANDIDLFSTFKGHAVEINWPGPVLLVDFSR